MVFVSTGNQNSYLVKRNTNGGVRFSRDPLNVTNVHSRKVSS
jgi:large subunit ribosomal protein L28e